MKRIPLMASILVITGIISACCTAKKSETMQNDSLISIPGPKVIIYKTTKDYSQLVPVTLSEDKMSVESYPDVKDVYFNGILAYPTLLNNGYLLDNRGINKNVAFLNLTYEEYSKLPKTPSPQQLLEMISDSNPLVIMYNCGPRSKYKNIEQELNSKIDSDDFSAFTKLK